MAFETEIFFALIAGIIFVGFAGEVMFRKIGIPGVLLLLLIGYALGPALGFLDVQLLESMQFLINPLALLLLTFGGGMQMNIYRLVHESNRALLLAAIVTVFSIAVVAGIWVALGYNLMLGIILGAILAGTASEMVGPIAEGLTMTKKAVQALSLESATTDVLSVVLTIILTTLLVGGEITIQGAGKEIASFISIGVVMGLVFGMGWISLSKRMESYKFSYILTLAILLIAYVLTDFIGGSGAIAALLFGIVLGNYREIGKMFKFNVSGRTQVVEFHGEITFLVRTFFFVYMGILVSISSTYFVGIGVGLIAALIVARWAATKIAFWKSDLAAYRSKFNSVMPRGLATAVLASYPMMYILDNSPYLAHDTFTQLYNEASTFPEIAFVVIVGSIALTTIWVYLGKRGEPSTEEKEMVEKEVEEAKGVEETGEGAGEEEEEEGEHSEKPEAAHKGGAKKKAHHAK